MPSVQPRSSHPRGLYVLFFTELWERYSFYSMMAILTLYMNEQLHFDVAHVGRLERLPYGLLCSVEKSVDFLVIGVVRAVVRRRRQLGAGGYDGHGQVVVYMRVHPGQRELDGLDVRVATGCQQRLPGHRYFWWRP